MEKQDVIIIGNGIISSAIAFALTQQDPDLRISIIGPAKRQGGATLSAGAMLGVYGEVTAFTHRSMYGKKKHEMSVESNQLWPDWLEQINLVLGQPVVKLNKGTHILLNAKSSTLDNENYNAILKALEKNSAKYDELDPLSIQGMKPEDDARPLRALFLPEEGWIDPMKLLHAIESALNTYEYIQWIHDCVHKIEVHDNQWVVRTLSEKKFSTKKVVLAAGAFSQKILDTIPTVCHKIPKILSGFGNSLTIKSQQSNVFSSVVRTPNRAGACGMHIVPLNDESMYVGASNSVFFSPKIMPVFKDNYYLLERAMEQFNQDFYNAEIVKWQTGNRPVTIDTFPLIGKTSVPGLYIATGTYRDGILMAPYIAKILARQIVGLTISDNDQNFLNLFSPERLPIQTMTKQQSIDEFVIQYLAAGAEHNMKLPKISWHLKIKDMIYQLAHDIYDQLDINIGIPTDILIMLAQEKKYLPICKSYYHSVFTDEVILN